MSNGKTRLDDLAGPGDWDAVARLAGAALAELQAIGQGAAIDAVAAKVGEIAEIAGAATLAD